MVMEVARARVMAFSMGKEGHMWNALKKLIGADEEGSDSTAADLGGGSS